MQRNYLNTGYVGWGIRMRMTDYFTRRNRSQSDVSKHCRKVAKMQQ